MHSPLEIREANRLLVANGSTFLLVLMSEATWFANCGHSRGQRTQAYASAAALLLALIQHSQPVMSGGPVAWEIPDECYAAATACALDTIWMNDTGRLFRQMTPTVRAWASCLDAIMAPDGRTSLLGAALAMFHAASRPGGIAPLDLRSSALELAIQMWRALGRTANAGRFRAALLFSSHTGRHTLVVDSPEVRELRSLANADLIALLQRLSREQ